MTPVCLSQRKAGERSHEFTGRIRDDCVNTCVLPARLQVSHWLVGIIDECGITVQLHDAVVRLTVLYVVCNVLSIAIEDAFCRGDFAAALRVRFLQHALCLFDEEIL
jgi:hypothetical protein